MKVDETIESVGRVWQQITILIILHLVFLGCAIIAGLTSASAVAGAMHGVEKLGVWPSLRASHTSLQSVGLGLPVVAGIAAIIYLVTFQRLSMMLGRLPVFRLTYSQPALWKAGKCFDELRKLIHYFDDYTASQGLEDLEVTLGIAIAQYSKEFKEHYGHLVESRIAKADVWSVYHSGFGLLMICSVPILFLSHTTSRSLLLPVGLIVAMVITRCCWEAQMEHVVLGRLRFAIDCAVIFNVKEIREETVQRARSGMGIHEMSYEGVTVFSRAAIDNYLWNDLFGLIHSNAARETQAYSVLLEDLDLAAEMMKPPPRGVQNRKLWVLHYVRKIWPLSKIGALPFIPNEHFRFWITQRLRHTGMEAILARMGDRMDDRLVDEVRRERLRDAVKSNPLQLIDQRAEERPEDVWMADGSFSKWFKKARSRSGKMSPHP